MAGERERYLAAGMDGCLTKPVDWGELFAALARHGGAADGDGAGPPGPAEAVSPAPVPADEPARLAALRAYAGPDDAPDEARRRVARLAAELLGAPIAVVALVDKRRVWARAGVGLDAAEAPREAAFCARTILSGEVLHVPDARRDPRFAGNPLVAGEPGVRFYAGAPLAVAGGHRVGTVCVMDTRPRGLDERQRQGLADLAALAAAQLELARLRREGGRPSCRIDQPGGSGTADRSPPAAPAGEAVPLVDRAMLDALASRLPAAAFAGLVGRGIGNAERACGRLGTLPAGSEELAREAHSLKGTWGSFGRRRVSVVAGEIEAAAKAGEDVAGLVGRLGEVVVATRAELRAAGLLHEPRAVEETSS